MEAISSLHTHTFLCNHAEGRPADYFEQARSEGCTALGFSDHCPFPSELPDSWQNVRMKVQEAAGYIQEVNELKGMADFPVYAGFECEWDKRAESWYKDMLLGEFGADYLVLGSHWVTIGDSHVYILNKVEKKDLFRYTDQTIEAMQSGLFAFLAHPDVLMGHGRVWDSDVESCMKAIIEAARELNLPLEVNGYGFYKPMCRTENGMRYAYPVEEFWQLAAASGVRVICNSDAHDPSVVLSQARKSREWAARFGIIPEDNILKGVTSPIQLNP